MILILCDKKDISFHYKKWWHFSNCISFLYPIQVNPSVSFCLLVSKVFVWYRFFMAERVTRRCGWILLIINQTSFVVNVNSLIWRQFDFNKYQCNILIQFAWCVLLEIIKSHYVSTLSFDIILCLGAGIEVYDKTSSK